jgi:hypothetical protein
VVTVSEQPQGTESQLHMPDWAIFLDVLSNLQQLEILLLDRRLPEESLDIPRTSLIVMPNLRYLDIKDDYWEVVDFLERVSFGPRTRFGYINDFYLDIDKLARTIQLLITGHRSTCASPLTTLSIQAAGTKLTFVGWVHGAAMGAPAIKIQLDSLVSLQEVYTAIATTLHHLGREVQNLRLDFCDLSNGAKLMSLFTLPHVHTVAILGFAVVIVMDFLASLVTKPDNNAIWPCLSHVDITQGYCHESDMRLVETALGAHISLTGRRLAWLSLQDGYIIASDVADVVVHRAPALEYFEYVALPKEWDVNIQALIDDLVHGENHGIYVEIPSSRFHDRYTNVQQPYARPFQKRSWKYRERRDSFLLVSPNYPQIWKQQVRSGVQPHQTAERS